MPHLFITIMKPKFSIEHFEEIDSTSSYLARKFLDKPDLPAWHICSADFQSAGRGQRGNRWESGSGENLTFSIFLRPDFINVNRQFLLVELFALAVKEFLEGYGIAARIKWPNDIYVGNRKICGMLFENSISDSRFSTSIVGIGLNLNQMEFSSNAVNPTSVAIETGSCVNREKAFTNLVDSCFRRYTNLAIGITTPQATEVEYLSAMYRLGEFHSFQRLVPGTEPLNVTYKKDALNNSNEIFSAKVCGVTAEGLLELEKSDGSIETFGFKEVKFLI